jgi:hypothetical protein
MTVTTSNGAKAIDAVGDQKNARIHFDGFSLFTTLCATAVCPSFPSTAAPFSNPL